MVRPIGFIADDITGATDLASALVGRGFDTRIVFGSDAIQAEGDAVVVALKIRSVPARIARARAESAAVALQSAGIDQIFSKYCSTFDSTPEGNIGPIADALADLTRARRVVHTPAYPANARTVYRGHLFVGDELLSESPMRDHPLNPMRDSHLGRVLGSQTGRSVDLLTMPTIVKGPDAIVNRLADIGDRSSGGHHIIADSTCDEDLDAVAAAVASDPIAAGSAAFGAAFAVAARARVGSPTSAGAVPPALPDGPAAVLAGSLSSATREQIKRFGGATLMLRAEDFLDGDPLAIAAEFAQRHLSRGPILIASDRTAGGRATDGSNDAAGDLSGRIEVAMGKIGVALSALGVRRLIVAGGETSGAVADALRLRSARTGADIAVGVPWILTDSGMAIAFKSGNFGAPTFFRDALVMRTS
ncbi:3-oxo-tetronate kinase [Microbacterium sediminicola]